MRITNQLIVAVVVLIGLCVTTQASAKGKKIYRLESCDCVGMKDSIPTFLSDYVGEPHIDVEARSIAKAQKKVDRMCYNDFRGITKVKRSEVSGSGCKKFVSIAGSGDWKAL